MAAEITLDAALRCALLTLKEQPTVVPAAPLGWHEMAEAALATSDADAMTACAREIASAHSQYRADFGIKGWLFDLRNLLPLKSRTAAAI